MFDIDSIERQAHHQFMTMNPSQYNAVSNHAYLGHAAAYHAAITFTDNVEASGLPESQVRAQTQIIAYAREFIDSNICARGLRLDGGRAMQYAMESLRKTIYNPNPRAWRINHTTPGRAFRVWSSEEDGDPDNYERWRVNEYYHGNFGPNRNDLPAPGPGDGPDGGDFNIGRPDMFNPPPGFNNVPPRPGPSGSGANAPPPGGGNRNPPPRLNDVPPRPGPGGGDCNPPPRLSDVPPRPGAGGGNRNAPPPGGGDCNPPPRLNDVPPRPGPGGGDSNLPPRVNDVPPRPGPTGSGGNGNAPPPANFNPQPKPTHCCDPVGSCQCCCGAANRPVGCELKLHCGNRGGYYGRVQLANCTGNIGAYACGQAQCLRACTQAY